MPARRSWPSALASHPARTRPFNPCRPTLPSSLLTALASYMAWPTATQPTPPNAIHFTGFSAGSYTAIALETEYRLLSHRFQQPLCPGCATLGALASISLRCYSRIFAQATVNLSPANGPSAASTFRTTSSAHGTRALLGSWLSPLRRTQTCQTPSVLIQVLDTGTGPRRPTWLEGDTHNYAHLLQVTVARYPALLPVQATPPDLCAYSASFAPPDALEELTAYLLSWAASAMPLKLLTAEQLRRAAASDGAHRGSRAPSRATTPCRHSPYCLA